MKSLLDRTILPIGNGILGVIEKYTRKCKHVVHVAYQTHKILCILTNNMQIIDTVVDFKNKINYTTWDSYTEPHN